MIKIAFSSLAYPYLSLQDVIEKACLFKVEGVELRVSDDGVHLKPIHPLPRFIVELIKSSGVKIPVISGYASFAHADPSMLRKNVDLAKTLIHIAHSLEARGVRVLVGKLTVDSSNLLVKAVGTINDLARVAEDHGVTLLVETHDEIAIPRYLLQVVEMLAENVGLLYDVANVIMSGGFHEEVFPHIYHRVKHVHIKDFTVREGKVQYTRAGEGVVPICRVVKDLISINYENFISIEWEKLWHPYIEDPDVVIPQYIDYIKNKCILLS